MTDAGEVISTERASSIARERPSLQRIALMLTGVLALGILWQQRFGTIPDVSWAITMCERVLAGQRLYSDILEVNPPFTVWLYLPPVALARKLGVAPEIMVHAWAYLAAVGGLGLAAYVVSRARIGEGLELFARAPFFLAVLVLLPGNAFGQREHFGVSLVLPLLALMAWRAKPMGKSNPSLALAMLVGLCASALVLVKPYYAVVILAPAVYVAWRRRRLALLFAPEYWVIGAVCVAYLWVVLAHYPEFLRDVYPLLNDTYVRVRSDTRTFAFYTLPLGALYYVVKGLWPRGEAAELASITTIASLAAILPLVYQGKGWAYHAYPAVAFGLFAMICLFAIRSTALGGSPSDKRRPSYLLVVVTILAVLYPFTSSQRPNAALVNKIREVTTNPSVALIGFDIASGHPLTRMIGGTWISAYCADWLGASALFFRDAARNTGDVERADHYQKIVSNYVEHKTMEIERSRPDLLLIPKNTAFWLDYLVQEAGYGAILKDYRTLTETERTRVLIRADYHRAGS